FNIGQSYYNERNFNDSVKYFKRFIQAYPSDTKLSLAVNQILDAHNQREDYKSLIKDGEWFLKSKRVGNPSLRDNVKEIVSQAKLISVRKQSSSLSQEGYAKNMLKLASKFKGTDLGDKALYEAFILYRSQRSSEMYTPGSILLKNHSISKYAKQVAGDMVQTALLTADFDRASKYLEYYGTQYPKDKESELFLNQAAEIRSIIRDYAGAKRVYNKIGNLKEIAEMDLLARDWQALLSSSQKVSEPLRTYYLAMAYRELKQSAKAEQVLKSRMTRIKGSGNKDILVKAIYLQALLGLDRYQKIRFSRKTNDQAVVGQKTAGLQALTQSFSSVIATGDPEMTLAALSGLGELYKGFGTFLKEAKIPKGLNKDQKEFYKNEIQKQVSSYIEQSNSYFNKCLDVAKQANLFSKFLVYCKEKSQAVKIPGLVPRFKENENANIENLRKALFDRPRDPQIYRDIIEAQIIDKNFGAALATANRATEMFPENTKIASAYIYVLLHIGDFREAGLQLSRAVKIDAYNSELKAIEYQIKKYFGFAPKKQVVSSSVRSFLPGWL
ncbi:MAG: tetratricopeptide repeat protein, partial [Bdellovibrionota bacterium]|nr:tetratricopeptide repeat protein [Bdellovibrionota bacterium]